MAAQEENVVIGLQVEIQGKKDTMLQMQNEANELSKALKVIGDEEGKTSDAYKKADKDLKAHNQSIKDAGLELKNASNELIKAKKAASDTPTLFNNIDKATGGVASGFTALAANPIVLIITALVATFQLLKESLSRSEEGANALNKISGIFSVTIGVLMDKVNTLAMWLIKAFETPKQAISDLGEFIKQNLYNRVIGLKDLFVANFKIIQSAIKLDFEGVKKGLADYGESIIKISTGVDGAFDKIKNGLKDLNDEVTKKIEINNRIEDSITRLAAAERKQLIDSANLEKDIALLKEKSSDKIKYTAAERIGFIQQAIALQNKEMDQELVLAKERARIRREQSSLGLDDAAAKMEQAKLDEAVIKLEINNSIKKKELIAQLTEATNANNLAIQKELQLKISIFNEEIRHYLLMNESKIKSDIDYNDESIKKEKERLDTIYSLKEQSLTSQFLLESEKMDKASSEFILKQEKYNNDILSLQQTTNDQKLVLDTDLQAKKDEKIEAQKAKNIEDELLLSEKNNEDIINKYNSDMAIYESEYNEKVAAMDRLAAQDVKGYNTEAALTAKKAKLDKEYNKQKLALELETSSQIAGVAISLTTNLSAAFEGHAKAQKVIDIAGATISGIKGSLDAYLGMIKVIPGPVGMALGAVSAASVAVSSALSIKKMMAVNPTSSASTDTSFSAPSIPSISSSETATSSNSIIENTNSSIGNGIVSRNTEDYSSNTSNKIQTVLVVDDVTFNQSNISDNSRISTL